MRAHYSSAAQHSTAQHSMAESSTAWAWSGERRGLPSAACRVLGTPRSGACGACAPSHLPLPPSRTSPRLATSHPTPQTAAARAREFIKAGGEPRCLMDFWAQKCLAEIDEAEAQGLPPPSHTTIHRMVRWAGRAGVVRVVQGARCR